MASERRFSWGETVRVSVKAPAVYNPGAQGSVCGIVTLQDEDRARTLGEDIGATLYLLELADGAAVEIPERWLETNKGSGAG